MPVLWRQSCWRNRIFHWRGGRWKNGGGSTATEAEEFGDGFCDIWKRKSCSKVRRIFFTSGNRFRPTLPLEELFLVLVLALYRGLSFTSAFSDFFVCRYPLLFVANPLSASNGAWNLIFSFRFLSYCFVFFRLLRLFVPFLKYFIPASGFPVV